MINVVDWFYFYYWNYFKLCCHRFSSTEYHLVTSHEEDFLLSFEWFLKKLLKEEHFIKYYQQILKMYLQCVYLFLQKCQLLHWPGYSCIYNVLLALMLPFKLYLLKDPCQMHKKLSSLWQNSTPGNYHLLLQRASF